MDNVWSVLITAITVLGGTSAFRFYEKRAMRKERDEEVAALRTEIKYLTDKNRSSI